MEFERPAAASTVARWVASPVPPEESSHRAVQRHAARQGAGNRIGTALFERHSRGMTLTGAGRRLLPMPNGWPR